MRRSSNWGNLIKSYMQNGARLQEAAGNYPRLACLEHLECRSLLSADLSVAMSAARTVLSGDILRYDITVANQGPDVAQNVVITDELPADTVYVTANLGGTSLLQSAAPPVGYTGTVAFSSLALAAGQSLHAEIIVRVASGLNDGDSISNAVHVVSDVPDSVPTNDTADASTIVHPPAVLISGTVYFDGNLDGIRQEGEPGVDEIRVFVDLNDNGELDAGEPVNYPNWTGGYQFALAQPGAYTIREVPEAIGGLVNTNPVDGSHSIVAQNGSTFTGIDFGVIQTNNVIPVKPVADRFTPADDASAAFVIGVYRNVLERSPDAAGLAHWTHAMSAGMARARVADAIWTSAEHRGLEVDFIYETYLHRSADSGGRIYWTSAFAAGFDEQAIIATIVGGAEFRAAHPTDQQFLEDVYDKILMVTPDPEGIAYWTNALQHGLDRAAVADHMLHAGSSARHIVDSFFAGYLHRKSDVVGGTFLTVAISNGSASVEMTAVKILASDEYFSEAAASVSN
jgi:uncharacterized repeat protein (TIGR01451 family)